MNNEDRAFLIEELEQRFIPFLAERGFVKWPLTENERASGELRVAFPFDHLKRTKGADLQLLEIQFDKRGTARFAINIGVAPPEGVTLPWGHFAQSQLITSGLPEAYRLHSSRMWAAWFSPGWFPGDMKVKVAKVVGRVIDLYPEIETWFATKEVGPHLRRFGFPHSAVAQQSKAPLL